MKFGPYDKLISIIIIISKPSSKFNPRSSHNQASLPNHIYPLLRILTFKLDEGELIDSTAQRLVVQGEIQQRQTSNLLDTLGAAPRAGGSRRSDRQHTADLQEGGAIRFFQRLDAERE